MFIVSYYESQSSADRIIMLLEAADRTEKLMWMSSIRAHILFADHSSKSTQESENTPANTVNAAEGAAQESGSDAASSKAKSINSDWTKYQIFLSMNEEIVMLRVLNKPNPIGIPYRRLVILTSFHRLLYIEPNTLDVKGEISLSSVNAVNKVSEVICKYIYIYISVEWIDFNWMDVMLITRSMKTPLPYCATTLECINLLMNKDVILGFNPLPAFFKLKSN